MPFWLNLRRIVGVKLWVTNVVADHYSNFHKPYSTKYYNLSKEVLEQALSNVPAYKSWKAFDPGKEHDINFRYALMPVLTKEDIRSYSPLGFMPKKESKKKEADFPTSSQGRNITEKFVIIWFPHKSVQGLSFFWRINV